MTVDMTA